MSDKAKAKKTADVSPPMPPPSPNTPTDPELFAFLDALFDDDDWPQAIALCVTEGRGSRRRTGAVVRLIEWKASVDRPRPTKPSKAELVVLANNLVAAARQRAHAFRASCHFVVNAVNARKGTGEGPYAQHILEAKYGDLAASGAPAEDEEEDDDGGTDSRSSLVTSTKLAQKQHREMFNGMKEMLGMAMFTLSTMNERLTTQVERLMERNQSMHEAVEKAKDGQAARELAAAWQQLQVQTVTDAIGGVKRYLPLMVNGFAQRKVVPTDESPAQIVASQFLDSLSEAQAAQAFGTKEPYGRPNNAEALFTFEQTQMLFLLASGKAEDPRRVVLALRDSFTLEQQGQAMALFQPNQIGPVVGLMQQMSEPEKKEG